MSETLERYERLADAFAATVAAVPADLWESPFGRNTFEGAVGQFRRLTWSHYLV